MLGSFAVSGSTTVVPSLKSLTFINSASTVSNTSISYPTDLNNPILANDIAILFRILEGTVRPNNPADYISAMETSPRNSTLNGTIYYKQLTAQDISSGSILFPGAQASTMSMLLIFRPNFTVSSLAVVTGTNTVTATTFSASVPTAGTSNGTYIGLGHFASSTSTFLTLTQSPDIMTEIDHGTTGAGRSETVLYTIFNQNSTARGVTVSASDGGTNLGQTIALRVI